MSALHPTSPRPKDKPAKSYPDFPLFAHATQTMGKEDAVDDAPLRPVGRP